MKSSFHNENEFTSTTGFIEYCQMHSTSDKIIENLFQSLVQRYQVDLKQSVKGINLYLMVLMDYTTSEIR